MFIIDHPNEMIPNGGSDVFSYQHNIRINIEQNENLSNNYGFKFKFFHPIRYDILINNIHDFYLTIKKLDKSIIPVIYCLHECENVVDFLENLTEIINKNGKINHFILITNCNLDLSNYFDYLTHLQTNHLLSWNTETYSNNISNQQKIYNYINTPKHKIFLSLNKNTTQDRPHRLRLLCWYLENKLIENGYVSSLLLPERKDDVFKSSHKEIQMLENYYDEFIQKSPMILDWNGYDDSELSAKYDTSYLYNETLFSIVTETSYTNTRIFITEKTPKSIRNLHPFLILGDWNIHKKLEELGFKLYHDLIDYSFDSIKDNDLRFIKFTEEVSRLIKNKDIIYEWYKSNKDKLIYNYEHLIKTFNIKNEAEYISNYLVNFNLNN